MEPHAVQAQAVGGRDMSAALVEKVKAERDARMREIVRILAHEMPDAADLTPEAQEQIARAVAFDGMKDKMKAAVALERVDYEGERAAFLRLRRSPGTARVYGRALGRLEEWCNAHDQVVLALGPAEADDYVVEARGGGRAPATVRLEVSACAAFFSWLERRHATVRNPFRGTRERPAEKAVRRLEVPTAAEVTAMLVEATGETHAAVLVLSELGLRVGALPTLEIRGKRWTATSKGREISGEIPEDLKKALVCSRPFAHRSADGLAHSVRALTRRMHEAGKLAAEYSVHDLRHAFAVGVYERTHDVYAVKLALNHQGVAHTERYLR